jgi:PPOX class probable F420-dependent enzyme
VPFFDPSMTFGQRAQRRLREDVLAWLTTVRADGQPQPSAVWFLWDGEDELLLYSQPAMQKLRNIERNPRVSLHLDGDGRGGDIVIVSGTAAVDEDAPGVADNAAYVEKYAWGFERLGLSPQQFASRYSVPVRLHASSLRGH